MSNDVELSGNWKKISGLTTAHSEINGEGRVKHKSKKSAALIQLDLLRVETNETPQADTRQTCLAAVTRPVINPVQRHAEPLA
jgi:hypothetical protein